MPALRLSQAVPGEQTFDAARDRGKYWGAGAAIALHEPGPGRLKTAGGGSSKQPHCSIGCCSLTVIGAT
jgi:hypothetical protein